MWIKRRDWENTSRRLEQLEQRVEELEKGTRVYVHEGYVHAWPDGTYRLPEALNVLARHIGFRWMTRPEVRASLEGTTVGKDAQ